MALGTIVVLLRAFCHWPASVYSIMTHHHVDDLVRHHIHRRHPVCPTSDRWHRSPVRSCWLDVCIDSARNPSPVGSEVCCQVSRQIDDHQCRRSTKICCDQAFCCAPPGSRTQNLRIKSPAQPVRPMLRSPQSTGFVRIAIQGVLPSPAQSEEFVAKLDTPGA